MEGISLVIQHDIVAHRQGDDEVHARGRQQDHEVLVGILIGVAAGWLWVLFTKIKLNQFIALPIVGFVGSMVNTVTVMGSIYFLFAQQYAEAKEVALTAVFGLVMGTVTASGIPEAIAAAILVLALGKVLVVVFRKMNLGAVNVESAK